MRLIQVEDAICEGTINLYWKKNRYISRASHQFKEFLIKYFNDLKDCQLGNSL